MKAMRVDFGGCHVKYSIKCVDVFFESELQRAFVFFPFSQANDFITM